MAQVLIRDLDQKLVSTLKRRARRHGRSLQGELKAIIETAAEQQDIDPVVEVRRVRAMFASRTFSDSSTLIREDRSR
jgi:plasmid stability protein